MSDDAAEYPQYRFRPPAGACDVVLIRHGESQPARFDEPAPLVGGQADPPLGSRGQAEAERVGDRLGDQPLSAVYVTTLQRTAQTAAPLAARLGLAPRVEADLREVHLGEWEGAEFRRRVRDHDPVAMQVFVEQRWDVIPGAESNEAVFARLRAGLGRIAAGHPVQRVAVFSHGGVIGVITALATGASPFAFLGADNASITHLVIADDRWILRRFNDTAHLPTDLDRPVD